MSDAAHMGLTRAARAGVSGVDAGRKDLADLGQAAAGLHRPGVEGGLHGRHVTARGRRPGNHSL